MKLRNRAMVLILAEIIFIVTSAFWEGILSNAAGLVVFYFAFFCMGGYALARDKKWLWQYILLCVGSLVCGFFDQHYHLAVVGCVCAMLAHLLIFKVLIWHSFVKPKVPKSDRILSGIAGYILLGLFWATLFMFQGKQHPGAILNQVSGAATTRAEELYYSFVTITSLGYGDIVPVSPMAKVIATFAGLSGVLFSAIFIAALISNLKDKD